MNYVETAKHKDFEVTLRYINCEGKRGKRLRGFIYFNPVACGRCSTRFHNITFQKTALCNYSVNLNVGEVSKLHNDRPTNLPLSFLFCFNLEHLTFRNRTSYI
jgi:hypothetical protein